MRTAVMGDTVKAHYTGAIDDGTVFDSSQGREPLQFILGQGQLIKAFEEAVVGMAQGDSKTVKIPAAEAYGLRQEELVLAVPRLEFPPDIEPEVGLCLSAEHPDGGSIEVVVTEVTDEAVTVDANHPLSGYDLTFSITIVEIM